MTGKKKVAEIFNDYFSLIQNVLGEEHDSDPNVAMDISIYLSIAAIRDECVWLLSLSLMTSHWPKLS